ncbi:MAG: hypothetical protein M3507_11305, partial [Actinomycetota bacterium]|nr:hypothetical protein [Actinomycetota bacterium]
IRVTAAADATLKSLAARARAADPVRALARGWSLTHRLDGTLVRGAGELAPGEVVVTTLAQGRATSTVTDVTLTETLPAHQPGEEVA